MARPSSPQELLDALDRADRALSSGDIKACEAELSHAQSLSSEPHPDVLYMRALWFHDQRQDADARACLERALHLDPSFADAHYALAAVCEDAAQREAMIDHWLRVRELDEQQDRAVDLAGGGRVDRIERVARELLEGLPAQLGERLRRVPVILDDRPSRELVETGFDPRAFGLFDGLADGFETAPVPTRIVLFTHNLLADFGDDAALLDEQIEITLLHEIGHFFGLDEEAVANLGLE